VTEYFHVRKFKTRWY